MARYPLHEFQQVFLEFTNRCNYRCLFCKACTFEPCVLRLKDFKDCEEIIKRGHIIDITGYGEVTGHPDFPEIVALLTKHQKKFSIVTNGSLLNEEKIDMLDNSSCYLLSISLNSLNPETYHKLTGVGDLSRVLNNISIIFSKKRNFEVRFTFVITAYNFGEMIDFVNFAHKHSVWITFYGLVPQITDYPDGLIVADTPSNRKSLQRAIDRAKKLKVNLTPFNFDLNRASNKEIPDSVLKEKLKNNLAACHPIYDSIFIGPSGNVKPCCWSSMQSMGNIRENTLDEIWLGEKYIELRRCVESGNIKHCKSCRLLG